MIRRRFSATRAVLATTLTLTALLLPWSSTALTAYAAPAKVSPNVTAPLPLRALGSNGQQLCFHDGFGDVDHIYVSGDNQNGDFVEVGPIYITQGIYNCINGNWWVGTVNVDQYNGDQSFLRTSYPDVPVTQDPGYDYYCYDSFYNQGEECTG